jgi:hypothetical protein
MFSSQRQRKFWNNLKEQLEKNEKKALLNNLKLFTKLSPEDMLKKLDSEEIQLLKKAMVTDNDSGSGFVCDVDHRAGELEKISCPTLIIHSKNDGCLPFSHTEYAHKKIKNSNLFVASVDSILYGLDPAQRKFWIKGLNSFRKGSSFMNLLYIVLDACPEHTCIKMFIKFTFLTLQETCS